MSTSYAGSEAIVKVGSTDIDASGWSADVEVSTYDTTTTADAGWDDVNAGTKKITGSVDFFYNVAKKPTGASIGLSPGTTVALTLYINIDDDEKLTGNALVTKLSFKPKVKEGFPVTFSFQNKGVWTLPS